MKEELVYRRDCDLFSESMNYERIIHDLMVKHHLTWVTNPENILNEDEVFEFARELLQNAQNVIDSAETVAYEKDCTYRNGKTIHYLAYDEIDENECNM